MEPWMSKREKGSSTVEFAASVVLVILMFLGMLQVGAFLWAQSIVENAARHGARMGSVSQGCAACDAVSAANSALAGQPLLQDASVSVLAPGGVVGSTVKIRVSANIPLFLPAGDALGLDRLTKVQAEATFRQEGW
jgi:Flp pilus assembly protein TadG